MSQKSITNFFKPDPKKRRIVEEAFKSNKKFSSDAAKEVDTAQKSGEQKIKEEIERLCKLTPALASNIGHTWFLALKNEFTEPYFKKLSDFVENERKNFTVYPPRDEVYNWTRYSKIDEVKVVILGQDPYHGPNQAHGISFSVKKGVPLPPSLINIFKEVKSDYPEFVIPKHGELIGWAEQGVLMLNASLTVRANNANSHSQKGWEKLTDAVIKYISSKYKNRVFLLWGKNAIDKSALIDKKNHLILQSSHPSPLSAHRGFLGCGHFKRANEYLAKNGLKPIDWTKL